MNIETQELGAGSYPEPKEENTVDLDVEINLTFEFESEFPKNWSRERITEEIKNDLGEYINLKEFKEINIDLY